MKTFSDYTTEQSINELFGFSKEEKAEKTEIKKVFDKIKKVTMEDIQSALAKLSKAGNKLANKLLKSFDYTNKSAQILHKKMVA